MTLSPGRPVVMTHQIVVRVDEALYDALKQDAIAHGRTVSQSVRFLLRRWVTDRTSV